MEPSEAWRQWRHQVDLSEYDARWDRLAAEGQAIHGEADMVERIGGHRVLDAGCGTGRVAIELARRGRAVVGVDNDPDMLALAKAKNSPVRWVLGDLATVAVDESFDVIVMAGNVLAFAEPADRRLIVANLARHLEPTGVLVNGASRARQCGPAEIDGWAADAGLMLDRQFATWEGEPFAGGSYRVSLYGRAEAGQ